MVKLYFSFADGVFDYVCRECTALCCRGQGFAGNLDREMGRLFQIYPSLESAVIERQGPIVFLATRATGCHFLRDDGLCGIEKEHGKALKPGVCTLFPFNSFSLIGKTLVVSPHFLCPLRVRVPAHPGAVEGTHAWLEPVIRESGFADQDYLNVFSRPIRLHPSEGVRSVLAREKAFRDRAAAALGAEKFSACLRASADDPVRLDGLIPRAAALLGLTVPGGPREPDGIDDIFLAVAPTLRLTYLLLPRDGILLALALAELVVRRLASLSHLPSTPQSVVQLVNTLRPALHLLASADTPVKKAGRGRLKAPPFGDPAMVFAAYRVLKRLESDDSILDILEREMKGLSSVADRSAFLVELGALIHPARKRGRKTPSPATTGG